MSPLDTLAPDQRAVLELVLRRGRSYGQLSELLGIPERDVRARADAGLRALAGEPETGVDSGRITDWLLGQQPDAEADRTRAAVARSEDARSWAAIAAERLRELDGAAVPAVPATDEEPAAAPPPPARAPLPTSKLGGAILIGVLALVVGGLLFLFLGTSDDDDDPESAPAAEQTAEPTPAAQASGNDIVLTGVGGSDAEGLMRLFNRENGTVQFAIAAQNVPPNEGREVYAVWFTREGAAPRRLGFAQTQVGEDGVLTTGGPQQGDEDRFPRWFATYDNVLVTRETSARARQPGEAVLEGTLPGAEG
jgi:Sigma-70, region 4